MLVARKFALLVCIQMFLQTSRKAMPGERRHTKHVFKLNLKVKHPRLKVGYKHTAGRGLYGNKTVLSKAHRKYSSTFLQMHPISQGVFSLSMVTGWFPWTKNCKVAMILKTALGLWFITPVQSNAKPLSFLQSVISDDENSRTLRPYAHWWRKLSSMASYSRISNFALMPGFLPKYARAAGTTALVLIPKLSADMALVSLPSGQLCLLINTMYVNKGGLPPVDWKFFINTKAGYWRNLGNATTVRGTVKNPNDHPHGGRTRAIKYPRTPWGKTAKKSRKPRVRTKLKSLTKRHKKIKVRPLPYWASRTHAFSGV
jgi:Ribosomal Proteins L2, C-terminal domain